MLPSLSLSTPSAFVSILSLFSTLFFPVSLPFPLPTPNPYQRSRVACVEIVVRGPVQRVSPPKSMVSKYSHGLFLWTDHLKRSGVLLSGPFPPCFFLFRARVSAFRFPALHFQCVFTHIPFSLGCCLLSSSPSLSWLPVVRLAVHCPRVRQTRELINRGAELTQSIGECDFYSSNRLNTSPCCIIRAGLVLYVLSFLALLSFLTGLIACADTQLMVTMCTIFGRTKDRGNSLK